MTKHLSPVPEELTENEFWKRFFFRVHQIEVEEKKRRALIQGTLEVEDEFSWEDDEEETPVSGKEAQLPDVNAPSPPQVASVPLSARESSEEGYDVVTPGTMSPKELKTRATTTPDGTPKRDSSEEDSDWE